MRAIKCIFCHKETTIHSINAQKKINGKVVTITSAPVYYCKDCDETFLSKEAQDVFTYIKDRNLDAKSILFNFEEISKKVYK
jgi:YgiT-type zinc finger domain-containing protein